MIRIIDKFHLVFSEPLNFENNELISAFFQQSGGNEESILRPFHAVAAEIESIQKNLTVRSAGNPEIGIRREIDRKFRPVEARPLRLWIVRSELNSGKIFHRERIHLPMIKTAAGIQQDAGQALVP